MENCCRFFLTIRLTVLNFFEVLKSFSLNCSRKIAREREREKQIDLVMVVEAILTSTRATA